MPSKIKLQFERIDEFKKDVLIHTEKWCSEKYNVSISAIIHWCRKLKINRKRIDPNFIDLTGKKFGMLKVLKMIRNKNNEISWICRCDCGNEKISKTHYLNNGETWHCGCSIIYKTKPFENLINRKFGSLFVLEKLENDKRGLARWKCKCDCGNISIKKQNT